MEPEAHCKGTALQGLIVILQADPARYRPLLPGRLRTYIDDPLLVSNTYPEADLQEILRVIGRELQPDFPDENIYEMFGKLTALRDTEGVLDEAQADALVPGLYRNLVSLEQGIARSIRTSTLLWQAYHGSGRLKVSRLGERTLRTELLDFALPCEELCLVNVGYMRQLAVSSDLQCEVTMPSCRGRGDLECVWISEYGPDVDVSGLDEL